MTVPFPYAKLKATMDINANVGSPCVRTKSWGFIGIVTNGKAETSVAIGVYSNFCDGKAHANAWMEATPTADRWVATPVYEEAPDEQA